MTALGLGLLLAAFFVVFLECADIISAPEWLERAAGFALLSGALLLVAGILVQVWRVMP